MAASSPWPNGCTVRRKCEGSSEINHTICPNSKETDSTGSYNVSVEDFTNILNFHNGKFLAMIKRRFKRRFEN